MDTMDRILGEPCSLGSSLHAQASLDDAPLSPVAEWMDEGQLET